MCICTHNLQVNCTIRPSCLSSNADDIPLLKNSNNVVLTKDTKETKVTAENVTPASTQPPCEPGKVFRKYCNTCRCFPKGIACTQKFCPSSIYNLDGTLVKSKSFKEKFDSFANLNLNDVKDNDYYSYDHFGADNKNFNIIPISGGKIGNTNYIGSTKIDPLSIQPTMDEVDNY